MARGTQAARRRRRLRFPHAPGGPHRRSAQTRATARRARARRQPAARPKPQARSSSAGEPARPLRLRPPDLLGLRAGAMGADRRHRRAGLDRHPSAADPVAGNPQAAALGSDPRRQRRDAGHARRHGRRRGADCANCRTMCRTPSSPSRTAASIRITASIRWGIARAAGRRHAAPRRLARRLDHHPAARQESVPDPGTHRVAQAAGDRAGALARAQIHQDADSRALSQPRLFRLRRLWRRRRGAALFRQIGAAIDAAEAAMLAGLVQSPSRLAPSHNPDGAAAPRRGGDRRHGGAENDHARCRQARAGASGARGAAGRRRLGQLRRRLGDGRGRRSRRQFRSGHRRADHDRSGAAKRGRAGAGRCAQCRRARSSISAKARWSR